MDLGIHNKVALVTGASSGLGYASAEALLKEGAKVAICSRTPEKVEAAVKRLEEIRPNAVLGIVADYTNPEHMKAFIAETEERLGTIDILVCSSGGPPAGQALEFDTADYQKAIDNNLLSMMNLTMQLLPKMQMKKWGRIVYITSSAAVQPIPSLALSCVARSGLHAYAKALSTQIAIDGITVNCVMPGKINTDRIMNLTRKYAEDNHRSLNEQMAVDFKTIPAGRYGQPRELGNAVAFLCGDIASYITGSAIAVDGGAISGLR